MDEGLVIVITIATAILLACAVVIWETKRQIKKDEKLRAEKKARLEAKLAEEMQKPKYYIHFKDKLGNKHNGKLFAPYIDHLDGIVTSKERAERVLARSLRDGFFEDCNGMVYPIHHVIFAKIEVNFGS